MRPLLFRKNWIFGTFFIFSFVLGCREPLEGCLDLKATNYNVEAENACTDCCVYPGIKMRVRHLIGTALKPDSLVALRYNEPYLIDGQWTNIQRLRWIFSDVQLLSTDGNFYGVTDTIGVNTDIGAFVVSDNFIKTSRDLSSDRLLSDFPHPLAFEGIRLRFGVSDTVRVAYPDEIFRTSAHPLSLDVDSINWQPVRGYLGLGGSIGRDSLETGPFVDVAISDNQWVYIPFDSVVQLTEGFNIRVALDINYSKLLSGIQFSSDDELTINSKIVSQLANALIVESVVVETP